MDRSRWTLIPTLLVTLLAATPVACGRPTSPGSAPQTSATGSPPPTAAAAPAGSGTAPTRTFAVGMRTLSLSRTPDRPLPTTLWYPASGSPGTAGTAKTGATPAAGRFPLVLVSHGLGGLPEYLAEVTVRLAAAGFIVAAPAYPNTNARIAEPVVTDVPNQPADASFVIDSVLGLSTRATDPLAGHFDPDNIAAAGHSAGGFTTAGMFTAKHDTRLRAGVIVAGGSLGTFVTPSAPILFVHGDRDPTVSYSAGRSAYDRLTWPKAFLTVTGGDHGDYLRSGRPGFDPMIKTVTDFLRSALYGDQTARGRLSKDGTSTTTRYEQQQLD